MDLLLLTLDIFLTVFTYQTSQAIPNEGKHFCEMNGTEPFLSFYFFFTQENWISVHFPAQLRAHSLSSLHL